MTNLESKINFTHLRVFSDYSIGKSTARIPDLAKAAHKEKMGALCITEMGNLCSSMEFSAECTKLGIKPLVGCNISLKYSNNLMFDTILIARDANGYNNLLQIVTNSFLKSENENCIEFADLIKYGDGLVALSGAKNVHNLDSDHSRYLKSMTSIFKENLFIEISRDGCITTNQENFLLNEAYDLNIPIVTTNPIHFIEKGAHEAHDALLCISQLAFLAQTEGREFSNIEHYFKSEQQMLALFSDLPEAIENTELISIKCSIWPKKRQPLLPKFSQDENIDLENQASSGIEKLTYGFLDEEKQIYKSRLEYELKVIQKMGFSGYFLIVSDFIKWSKKNGIPVGPGRGSGAGSIVAWALEIIDIDPIKFGLLFERFLNPERISMPDFDIDFCQERRGEVIEYVRQKYGNDKVANIITFGKLQARAVLRDVGRVMQIPYGQVDRICKMVPNNPANPVTLKEAIDLDHSLREMSKNDPLIDKLLSISLQLEGVNRHVSTHAAGVIIADRPLNEVVALYKDKNSHIPVIQYSLKYAEMAGLMKFDFLGLRTLSVIDNTIKLIKEYRGEDIEISNYTDKNTYELLSKGNVEGIFQFEGAGMKEAIKKLKPDKIDDLIALTSLYRPGPMDNLPDYIDRKHGKTCVEYPHPMLEGILKDTYGIIIYQEQVMQIAQKIAGYSMGEADFLRRAMGKKSKEEMEIQKSIFIERSIKNSISKEDAERLFAFIEKFASYGFNKSHAAAYSIISYKTAYLKANYTIEFLTASLNFELHDLDKIAMFCNNAKFSGIKILLPNINKSQSKFSINDGAIFYALGAIKNVGISATDQICKERSANGIFVSIENFVERCAHILNKRMMEGLIKSGALDSLFDNRRSLFECIETLIKKEEKNVLQHSFFIESGQNELVKLVNEWDIFEKSKFEFEFLGTYISFHPFELYERFFKHRNITTASTINNLPAYSKVSNFRIAGIVTSKKIKSSKRGKFAFLQITDQTDVLDLSLFDEKLLYETNELTEEGGQILCSIAVKSDAQRTRIIIEKVDRLEDIIKSSILSCDIYIHDNKDIDKVLSFTSQGNDGIVMNLHLNLNMAVVNFDIPGLRIGYSDMLILKGMKCVKVVENYC